MIPKFLSKISLTIHYWNRKRMFERKYREAQPYVTRDAPFEQEKYRRQLDLIKDRRYRRALEVGCGEGVFLKLLAPLCDQVTGSDISEEAIRRAREYCRDVKNVTLEAGNIADRAWKEPFDLVVATDVLYYLGQEHDWGHLQEVLARLCGAVAPGGRLLLANCHNGLSHEQDWLSLQVIRRYREECQRAGLRLVVEKEWEGFNGSDRVPYLISLLNK
jgi:predicted TPR repeat methyltransferase